MSRTTLFMREPIVRLLLLGLADKLRDVAKNRSVNSAFVESQVREILKLAKPKTPDERAVLMAVRQFHRGFVMQAEGRRIIQEWAVRLPGKLPKARG